MFSTVQNYGAKAPIIVLILVLMAPVTSASAEMTPCNSHGDCNVEAGEFCLQNLCREANDHRVQRLFSIGISPFYDLTQHDEGEHLASNAESILRGLLGSTVFFETLPAERTPPTAMLEGWMGSTILFQSWASRGAYAVVKGTLRDTTSGERALTLRLYLVESGEHVDSLFFSVLIDRKNLREELVRWADKVVGEFSGRPGILSTRIAYARQSKIGGSKEIYVTGLDGFEERPVTQNGSLNLLPSWGPKGVHVAYTSYIDRNPDLFLGADKFSGFESLNMGAEWSPDGTEVALSLSKDGNNEIYILDGKTGTPKKRLTNHKAIDSSPTWSPDGESLVFVSDRNGSPQLFFIKRDGSGLRHLATGFGYCTSPEWSPSGSLIAFNAMRTGKAFDIYLYDMGSGSVRTVTYQSGSNEDPSWSPDGRYLVFSSTRGSTRAKRRKNLFIISASGGRATKITRRDALYSTPTWSPW